MRSDVAPAAPPDARLPAKNLQNSFFLSTLFKKSSLYLSLKAKLSAWVGKYLRGGREKVGLNKKATSAKTVLLT